MAEEEAAAALPQIIITDSEAALTAARRLFPALGAVYVNGDASDFTVFSGRRLVLMPTAGNEAHARSLADRLVRIAAEVKLCSPEPERAAGWSIAELPDGGGQAWISTPGVRETIPIPAQEAEAATPGAVPEPPPPLAQAAHSPALEPPRDDIPPLGSLEPPPGARKRRRLSVVDGSAVRVPEEEEPLPAELSEDHLADAFAARHCRDWRYVKEWDRWYQYDGDGWRPDRMRLATRLAIELAREALAWPAAAGLTADGRKRMGQKRTAWNVEEMARNDRRIAAIPEQWDTDPLLLGCPGGAIDLRTGKVVEGSRDAYLTMRTAVQPEAGEPSLWLAHLDKALKGDVDTIGFLRRYLGYMLTGDVTEHCLVFFYGTGRNGKGTVVETIIKLLGDYGYAAPMNILMESKNERHPTELAALRARRAVSASEPPEGARWDDGRIRWLTGGDTITARGMRQDPFSFQPTHKLLLMGNHTPSLRSVDEAIQSRFRIIEFSYFFPPEERDPHFGDKLRAEWPRILNWMVQGCLEWQDAGLGLPERIERATTDYLQSEDEFADWLNECAMPDPDATMRAGDAYKNFRVWCEARGTYVPSQKSFGRKLKDRGFASVRTATARMVKGLSLKLGEPQPSVES